MDPHTVGLIGGIAGGILGLMGGAAGTYFSLKSARSPHEWRLIIKVSILFITAVAGFLILLWFTPVSIRPLVWLPYLPLLYWGIRSTNQKLLQLREAEAENANA